MHQDSDDTSFISDLPNGPLDEYRNRAKFDWKKLKIVIEEPNILKLKVNIDSIPQIKHLNNLKKK